MNIIHAFRRPYFAGLYCRFLIVGFTVVLRADADPQNTPGPAVPSEAAAPEVLPGQGLAQHDFFYAGEARQEQMYIVREINRQGETVWEWTPADAPGYKFDSLQLAERLPNGNTIINNWFNQWNGKLAPTNAPVQAIEVTPDKKIVWALRSWTEPADLGPATTIQLLDQPGASANLH